MNCIFFLETAILDEAGKVATLWGIVNRWTYKQILIYKENHKIDEIEYAQADHEPVYLKERNDRFVFLNSYHFQFVFKWGYLFEYPVGKPRNLNKVPIL